MGKKCRLCGGDLDWLGRCKLERATRRPKPKGLILLAVLVLLVGCAGTDLATWTFKQAGLKSSSTSEETHMPTEPKKPDPNQPDNPNQPGQPRQPNDPNRPTPPR